MRVKNPLNTSKKITELSKVVLLQGLCVARVVDRRLVSDCAHLLVLIEDACDIGQLTDRVERKVQPPELLELDVEARVDEGSFELPGDPVVARRTLRDIDQCEAALGIGHQ
jgi:hypothetical protein